MARINLRLLDLGAAEQNKHLFQAQSEPLFINEAKQRGKQRGLCTQPRRERGARGPLRPQSYSGLCHRQGLISTPLSAMDGLLSVCRGRPRFLEARTAQRLSQTTSSRRGRGRAAFECALLQCVTAPAHQGFLRIMQHTTGGTGCLPKSRLARATGPYLPHHRGRRTNSHPTVK